MEDMSIFRGLIVAVVIVVSIVLLILIFLKLEGEAVKTVYTCPKCKNECTRAELKHYDYEYNYEYRCAKCNTIVIEG